MLRVRFVSLVVIGGLLIAGAAFVLLRTSSVGADPDEAALKLDLAATASEFRITYETKITNTSSSPVRDIFLSVAMPTGTSFVEVTGTPAGASALGLRDRKEVAWLIPSIGPGATVGPFGFKVSVAEKEPGPVQAWARWTSPKEGTAISSEANAAGITIDLPKRGCPDCHSLRDASTGAVTIAYEAIHRGGPNHPKLPFDTKVETCLGCHKPGTGERENMGAVAPKMLRDIVHPAHLNSPSFTGTYKGNCFTCHNVDGNGSFTLLGDKLDKDFRGIPKTVPVPGIPPSERK